MNNESWLKTHVGLVEANELAMKDWACCRLRLGMVWDIPTLIYQPLGLTSLPPDLLSSDSSPAMATKSKDWSSSASLFDGYECEIIGSTRPKAFFHFGRYPFSSRSKAF